MRNSAARENGFTLIELVMTIVILGSSSLILIPFFQAITHSPDPLMRHRAVTLGQAMMDEVLAKKWDHATPVGGGPLATSETADTGTCAGGNRIQCYRDAHPGYLGGAASGTLGPEAGETRASYNDVDDYDGLAESGTFQNQTGTSFTLANYQRRVTVRYIASTLSTIDHVTPPAAGATDAKLILVTITSPTNEQFRLTSVVCNL